MYKAMTLIEILTTIVVMVIATYFISPIIFTLQDRVALNSEIENIQSFIYQLQTKARYSKRNYTLTISQNDNNWCMVAVRKPINSTKQIICDCLNKQFCQFEDEYHIYTPFHSKIRLKNKSLYPNAFINIDGVSGRLESKCIQISLNQESDILQFETLGRVYVAERDKRSTCKD
ncbi:Type II secretory pathway, pseudopilin PulG [Mannheimia sp. AT1]|uniref:Type II secretory pathway, pseudopilin PulG n=1 Tax=Mannheimia cairinae TaxID=3025936 RepID=A0ABT5MS82_9PAST|nr:Type II secretory pathway, pseudopilin PulG [Mannheimia cairinae]MDD0825027.1 Type II secretory pathway, pseudopilin PulG [Mannheimia cairinae]MDD0827265.1 Type II secretory pathway, pseudopilin PulG [Mannheimia cairinae]